MKALADTSLWRVAVAAGQATKVLEGVRSYESYENLAIVNGGLYFVPAANGSSSYTIQFLDFATNRIRTVANSEKRLGFGNERGLAVSPNAQWILYTLVEQAGSELMLVENFR